MRGGRASWRDRDGNWKLCTIFEEGEGGQRRGLGFGVWGEKREEERRGEERREEERREEKRR